MSLANNLLDAIDILAEDKVSSVQFDKTVRGSIYEVVDESIGKYKIKYQNSVFIAYALDLKKYSKGVQVYVVIPSSDFGKDPYILSAVKKAGLSAIDVLTNEDRMSLIGSNVITESIDVGFCSYKSNDTATNTFTIYDKDKSIDNAVIDDIGLQLYKQNSDYLLVGATFQTKLDNLQKVGSGNYGIRIYCSYYDARYKEEVRYTDPNIAKIGRVYELGVNNMVGNPYNFGVPNQQTVLFEIDSANLASINRIEAFCTDFPRVKQGVSSTYSGYLNPADGKFYREATFTHVKTFDTQYLVYDLITCQWYNYNSDTRKYDSTATDIIISDLKFEFYEALTEEDLQGLSLRITTPYGSYFTNSGVSPKTELVLHGELRIKGKKVNYNEQAVNFYWFVKDGSIFAGDEGYSPYGGSGWRCLNTMYNSSTDGNTNIGYAYAPDTYNKTINQSLCPANENIFKCVAVFKDGTDTASTSATTTLYNKTSGVEIKLISSMGLEFDFNEGQTVLTCYIDGKTKGDSGFNINQYRFYWTESIDARDPQVYSPDSQNPMQSRVIQIANANNFVTYEVTVKRITTKDGKEIEVPVGSTSLTLINGEPNGQYRLVLRNGTQIFKYTKEGISPTSPSLDEFDRITISALSFDIYNDKGQIVQFSSNEEKQKRMNIRWIWPKVGTAGTTTAPKINDPNNLTSMLNPTQNMLQYFKQFDYKDPSTNTKEPRWVLSDQAEITYAILNNYDLSRYDNNIILEVEYPQGQILTATTNFTFVKDGELGTNGTKYVTRITPKNADYEKIVMVPNSSTYRFAGVKTDSSGKKYDNATNTGTSPLKVQIWDGGTNPYKDNISATWTTTLADRGITSNPTPMMKVSDSSRGIFTFAGNYPNQNSTVKAAVTLDGKTYHASYPVEVIVDTSYYIDGGYRNCSYAADGTRSAYSQQPFTVRKLNGTLVTGTWSTTGWNGAVTSVNGNNKYVMIEPPATYDGQNVNNFITCKVGNSVVAYIPIELYLDRYGLSGIPDWDGSSIKINNSGSNYILAPQMGAGHKESDGTFTGITMGDAFESGNKSTGLFGYSSGARSIWLDANTGNATFGKDGSNQIKLTASSGKIDISTKDGDGMTLSGNSATLQSHNYSTVDGTGMRISLSEPSMRFGSGHFSVDSSGNLTAVGGGKIGSWYITNTNILANNSDPNNATIYLNGAATGSSAVFKTPYFRVNANGSFSASNSKFSVTADGTITATGGTIAGWTIGSNVLSGGTIYLDKAGKIGGGSGGSFSETDSDGTTHSGLRWKIDDSGYAYFTDVQINNNNAGSDSKNIISIGNKTGSSDGGAFTVDNSGAMTATSADIKGSSKIGGWKITDTTIKNGDSFILDAKNNTVQLGDGFKVSASSVTKSDGSHSGTHSGSHSGTGGWSGHPFSHNNGPIYDKTRDWADTTSLLTDINLETHQSVVSKVTVNDDGTVSGVSYVPGGIIGLKNWKYRNCDWLGNRGSEQSG